MGDAGEGLVDAEDRFQQRLAEREQEKQRRGTAVGDVDAGRLRELTSLRLARTELRRQQSTTHNDLRREQIRLALADIEGRLASLDPGASADEDAGATEPAR
jgi:hypothetical protein